MSGLRRLLARRGGVWVVLAIVAAAAAALLTAQAGARAPSGAVLVARVALPPGTLITAEDLALTPVASPVALPGLLRDPAEAMGRRALAPVSPGEPLTAAVLGGAPGAGPAPLAPGERAVAVPLSAAAGAGAVLGWGARVDVVASTGEGPAGRSRIVVADAEVLAVTTSADGGSTDPGALEEVLLRVSAADALRVTAALNFAREVRLLVRPPAEAGPDPAAAAAPAP
jgi:pilus assembly protein CpaB